MPDPLTSTPESPPAGPVIPVGLGTRLGQIAGALLAIAAVIQPLLEGDHDKDARTYAALSAGVLAVTIIGRMLQAVAAELSAKRPVSAPTPAVYYGTSGGASVSVTGDWGGGGGGGAGSAVVASGPKYPPPTDAQIAEDEHGELDPDSPDEVLPDEGDAVAVHTDWSPGQ